MAQLLSLLYPAVVTSSLPVTTASATSLKRQSIKKISCPVYIKTYEFNSVIRCVMPPKIDSNALSDNQEKIPRPPCQCNPQYHYNRCPKDSFGIYLPQAHAFRKDSITVAPIISEENLKTNVEGTNSQNEDIKKEDIPKEDIEKVEILEENKEKEDIKK